MPFMIFLDQIPKDLYIPWYLVIAFVGSLIVSSILFGIVEIKHRKN